MSDIINKLLNLAMQEAETKTVTLTRLDLAVTLKELSYDNLLSCRALPDAQLHYLLRSVIEPNFRDAAWFEGKMACPTPIDAMKKLLRVGEVERLCRAADELNGYGLDSVTTQTLDALENQVTAEAVGYLEKN